MEHNCTFKESNLVPSGKQGFRGTTGNYVRITVPQRLEHRAQIYEPRWVNIRFPKIHNHFSEFFPDCIKTGILLE